jgi:hypothetical protein
MEMVNDIEKDFRKMAVVVWTGFRWLSTGSNGSNGGRTSS